jgi:hypothetical protein
MKPLSIFLLLTALLIGLLPSRGEARGMACFGQNGLGCTCCALKGTCPTGEALSTCPCPGPEESLSLAQDLILALTVLELDLGAAGFIDTPTPVYRIFFGNTPQKPPPFLL